MKKLNYKTIACVLVTILFLITSTNIIWLNIKYDWLESQLENRMDIANTGLSHLSKIIIGKISKSDVTEHYMSLGIKISEEIDGVLYFNSIGYKFDKNDLLISIHPRIIGSSQVISKK